METGSAGQAGEVLQQHIEGKLRGAAVLHQAVFQAAPHGAHLQQLQGVGGHKQHLGGASWAVGAAAGPLQQPGQVFGAADLHHPLHRLKVDPQIQRTGAHHPAQLAGFDAGFDRFTLGTVDGAVVERQAVFHLRAGKSQALVPTLGLVAGVGEQQRAHPGLQPRHQLLVHPQPQVPAPGEAIDRVGQE